MSSTEDHPTASGTAWLPPLKELISILGGTSAVFAVILWYAGRRYAEAYFTAMGIPWTQINLSLWDYAELGWPNIWLILVILGGFVLFGLVFSDYMPPISRLKNRGRIVGVGFALVVALYILVVLLVSDQTIKDAVAVVVGIIILFAMFSLVGWSGGSRGFRIMMIVYSFTVVLNVLLLFGDFARGTGRVDGQNYAASDVSEVRFTLAEPFLTNAPTNTRPSASGNVLFDYEGFYLLRYNDGRYFLFKQLNAQCQPDKIYTVKDSDIRSIEYSSSPRPKCVPTAANTPTPSPTP